MAWLGCSFSICCVVDRPIQTIEDEAGAEAVVAEDEDEEAAMDAISTFFPLRNKRGEEGAH